MDNYKITVKTIITYKLEDILRCAKKRYINAIEVYINELNGSLSTLYLLNLIDIDTEKRITKLVSLIKNKYNII